jgi:hypothetical protein
MGHVQVGDSFFAERGPGPWLRDFENLRSGSNRLACRGEA